jgi:predicted ABC-type transport system involved in lysophospholipase L1 biosynthesis ATPase subunit
MNVLETNNVTKVFQEGREPVHVLNGVSLSLQPGEIVAMEGKGRPVPARRHFSRSLAAS